MQEADSKDVMFKFEAKYSQNQTEILSQFRGDSQLETS